jgi:hypothetical protein
MTDAPSPKCARCGTVKANVRHQGYDNWHYDHEFVPARTEG